MLYRRYREALDKSEEGRIYAAGLEVECPRGIDAVGELYLIHVEENLY